MSSSFPLFPSFFFRVPRGEGESERGKKESVGVSSSRYDPFFPSPSPSSLYIVRGGGKGSGSGGHCAHEKVPRSEEEKWEEEWSVIERGNGIIRFPFSRKLIERAGTDEEEREEGGEEG
jgi:hypothetical protein